MEKTAITKTPVNELIKKRWSPRSFAEQEISNDSMETILEAGTWAASSMNEQPWKYVYAFKGSEGFDKLASCLVPGNQSWAQNGAVLLMSLAKKKFDYKDRPNRHAMHDVGAANSTLMLQAADLDIYGHMMGGFDKDKTIAEFNIDTDEWEVACFIVLGYLDEPEKLDEPLRTREKATRSRKAVHEISQQI